jgi:predicted dinucleotide-binding enzyme
MKIAFIGYGNVGAPLASHLQKLGHEVTLAANDPNSESVRRALERDAALRVESPSAAVQATEVVFLATPFQANTAALQSVAGELKGKIFEARTRPNRAKSSAISTASCVREAMTADSSPAAAFGFQAKALWTSPRQVIRRRSSTALRFRSTDPCRWA